MCKYRVFLWHVLCLRPHMIMENIFWCAINFMISSFFFFGMFMNAWSRWIVRKTFFLFWNHPRKLFFVHKNNILLPGMCRWKIQRYSNPQKPNNLLTFSLALGQQKLISNIIQSYFVKHTMELWRRSRVMLCIKLSELTSSSPHLGHSQLFFSYIELIFYFFLEYN